MVKGRFTSCYHFKKIEFYFLQLQYIISGLQAIPDTASKFARGANSCTLRAKNLNHCISKM
jgi:hypothetical protein